MNNGLCHFMAILRLAQDEAVAVQGEAVAVRGESIGQFRAGVT